MLKISAREEEREEAIDEVERRQEQMNAWRNVFWDWKKFLLRSGHDFQTSQRLEFFWLNWLAQNERK